MYGDSFADHVIAGYKFLMRYYSDGDKIYIFGFSRGAYTARFLSEMLHDIGLLSRGNEEMVDFIWYQYSDFQRNRQGKNKKSLEHMIKGMHLTFCKRNATVHFLVSLGERRAKFKPALFLLDTDLKKRKQNDPSTKPDRLNEVWFTGNHGDVGGGWPWSKDTHPKMLLSDIPLRWMVEQAEAIDKYEIEHEVSLECSLPLG
jgi:uncharacterized protein (DUF2235 family)